MLICACVNSYIRASYHCHLLAFHSFLYKLYLVCSYSIYINGQFQDSLHFVQRLPTLLLFKQEDIFEVASVTLGMLEKIKIRHDNSGLKSAWFLDRVEIKDKLEEKMTVFPCSRWLATNEDDGQTCRELVPVDSRKLALQRKRSLSRTGSLKSLVDGVDLETKGRHCMLEKEAFFQQHQSHIPH